MNALPNRPNNSVQATPVCAILFVLSQVSERLTTIVGQNEMMPRPLTKIGVLVAVVGFWSGCASPTKELTPSSSAHTAETPIKNELVHLCVGDTVLISVEMDPDLGWPLPLSRPIASNGIIVLWSGQQVRVAGLTAKEAASTVQLALITNYFGIHFRSVNVLKVQPARAANPG
jgi:hypothetical protein